MLALSAVGRINWRPAMSILVLTHVVTGLVGIASGLIVVVGIFCRRRMARWNALFLATTAAACATGFAFLPADGVTSAQVVALFSAILLAVAAYARYGRHLAGRWQQVYAVAAVYALSLNVLIATAQSFLHFRFLQALAPTQHSPVYVAVKVALLLLCLAIAFALARRVGRQIPN
jgi:hypothetical protein